MCVMTLQYIGWELIAVGDWSFQKKCIGIKPLFRAEYFRDFRVKRNCRKKKRESRVYTRSEIRTQKLGCRSVLAHIKQLKRIL